MNDGIKTIETALRDGARLHTFLSGGGLRVARVERDGKLLGYGEAPHIEDAMTHAAEDIAAGVRDYTGDPRPSGPLDCWVRSGQTFDAFEADGDIVVELRGYEHLPYPPGVIERAKAGETVEWTAAGGVRLETSPCRFANDEEVRVAAALAVACRVRPPMPPPAGPGLGAEPQCSTATTARGSTQTAGAACTGRRRARW